MSKKKVCLYLAVIVIILIPLSFVIYKVVQYKTYIWLPNYFLNSNANDINNIENGHVLFLIADHHEPGHGERGIRKSTAWCEAYKGNIDGIYDDYRNSVQYTWFYPYDHLNSHVLFNLNELVYEGLGEIEFQWHHGPDTNETFPPKLEAAVTWFNSHGCMLPLGSNPQPQFGFVHGNWALDNSRGNPDQCGVNRELDILKKYGCYADFTFSTLGTLAQPTKVNSIYYAKDTDSAKSYNTGEDAKVGSRNTGFMIFEGPMCCDLHDLIWDCAALESTSPFKPHRINLWLKYAPTVKGKPEWLFVKVYTHGVQSKNVILSEQFRDMFAHLKSTCKQKGLSLHFVTAREAYNMVKAAEDGHSGNPEIYRDYLLKRPVNRVIKITSRLNHVTICDEGIQFELLEPRHTSFSLRVGPVKVVKGLISKYQCQLTENGDHLIIVDGHGIVEIFSSESVQFSNEVISCTKNKSGEFVYIVKAT